MKFDDLIDQIVSHQGTQLDEKWYKWLNPWHTIPTGLSHLVPNAVAKRIPQKMTHYANRPGAAAFDTILGTGKVGEMQKDAGMPISLGAADLTGVAGLARGLGKGVGKEILKRGAEGASKQLAQGQGVRQATKAALKPVSRVLKKQPSALGTVARHPGKVMAADVAQSLIPGREGLPTPADAVLAPVGYGADKLADWFDSQTPADISPVKGGSRPGIDKPVEPGDAANYYGVDKPKNQWIGIPSQGDEPYTGDTTFYRDPETGNIWDLEDFTGDEQGQIYQELISSGKWQPVIPREQ